VQKAEWRSPEIKSELELAKFQWLGHEQQEVEWLTHSRQASAVGCSLTESVNRLLKNVFGREKTQH